MLKNAYCSNALFSLGRVSKKKNLSWFYEEGLAQDSAGIILPRGCIREIISVTQV